MFDVLRAGDYFFMLGDHTEVILPNQGYNGTMSLDEYMRESPFPYLPKGQIFHGEKEPKLVDTFVKQNQLYHVSKDMQNAVKL